MQNGYPPPPPFGSPPAQPGWPPQAPAPQYPPAPQPGYPPQNPYAQPPAPPGAYPQTPGYPPPNPYAQPPAPPGAPPRNPYAQPYGPPAPQSQAPGYGRAGIMSGMDDADPTGSRLPHFNAIMPPPGSPPGTNGSGYRYVLQNKNIDFFDGRNNKSFFVSEWAILESDDPLLPPGRDAKYMILWGQEMSLGNTKALLGALEGLTDEDQIKATITEAKSLEAIDQQKQPYKGRILELRTVGTITKRNKEFTIHNWSPTGQTTHAHAQQFGGANPATVAPTGQYVPPGTPPMAAPPSYATQQPAAPPAYAPPPMVALPMTALSFPPAGWFPHPQAPGSFHNGREIVPEAELRARQAQGRA